MKYELGCHLKYKIIQPSTILFNINVAKTPYQQVLHEDLQLTPSSDFEEYQLPSQENRLIRVNAEVGELEVHYRATTKVSYYYADPATVVELPPAALPIEVIPYLYPSRYCQSDRLMRLATSEFGHLQPGYSRVSAICNWIYEKVTYLSGSSTSETSAYDTAIQRQGVCRDFAHLGIAFCRALNIPARIVAGYAYGLKPADFHACFEAYLGSEESSQTGRWYLFDPTRLVPQNGYIRIATGRDAADVAFATIFGNVEMQQMRLFVDFLLDSETTSKELPVPTTDAIALP
jgi:transglutaminase-like putative cysteine protease